MHTTDSVNAARRLVGPALAEALRDSRARSWTLVDDLLERPGLVPLQPGVNPVAWELAHVAWFAEFWVLRGPHRRDADGFAVAERPPRFAGPDALLDSARLPHAERWQAQLPDRGALRAMLDGQLDACLGALSGLDPADDDAHYFHRLALFHEDMHGEAFTWLRASLALPAPAGAALPPLPAAAPRRVPGGRVRLGAEPGGFAFDNELPAHERVLREFEIDSAPVSNARFLAFVAAGGYDEPAWWPGAAGAWHAQAARHHPERWRRSAAGWEQRWFDRWLPLEPDAPLIHVNAWEAEAWCRWAGRRLPTAAEWEHAATSSPSSTFHWGGDVWEWTADAFAPYPGFAPGPYREYSAPWFGSHRELRGGCFATVARMRHPAYRNFFLPERSDIFAGFRSAALDD